MNENDDMIFWDDMWNMSTKKLKKDKTCCGQWDSDGKCQCNSQEKNEK